MVCVPLHSLSLILRIEGLVASARVVGAGATSAFALSTCPSPGSVDHCLRESHLDHLLSNVSRGAVQISFLLVRIIVLLFQPSRLLDFNNTIMLACQKIKASLKIIYTFYYAIRSVGSGRSSDIP